MNWSGSVTVARAAGRWFCRLAQSGASSILLYMRWFRTREVWCPTWPTALLAMAIAAGAFRLSLPWWLDLLVVQDDPTADSLVIEGWLPDSALPHVIALATNASYRAVITTGGAVGTGGLSRRTSYLRGSYARHTPRDRGAVESRPRCAGAAHSTRPYFSVCFGVAPLFCSDRCHDGADRVSHHRHSLPAEPTLVSTCLGSRHLRPLRAGRLRQLQPSRLVEIERRLPLGHRRMARLVVNMAVPSFEECGDFPTERGKPRTGAWHGPRGTGPLSGRRFSHDRVRHGWRRPFARAALPKSLTA